MRQKKGRSFTNSHSFFVQGQNHLNLCTGEIMFRNYNQKIDHSLSWVQILTLLSLPRAPDAIMFWVGWHATDITVSVWPSNFWTTFLVWSSHKYTQLSSEPLTMYFPFVIEKVDDMQNFELVCPVYVFRNFPVEKFQSLCRYKTTVQIQLQGKNWKH